MNFVETPSFKLAIYAKGDPNSDKLALVLPGRLDTKDYIHMTSHADLLADKGFYAISIDPPFSWGSPGPIEKYSTTNYLKAVNELIDQIGKPTLLIGHSRGGSISMLASDNQHVKAIAAIMASYGGPSSPSQEDIKRGIYTTTRDIPPGDEKSAEQKEFSLPLSYFADGAMYNPADKLKVFTGPKFLICASHDTFSSPPSVRKIYDSLDEPKMFLELNTEHDYRLHADMVKAVNKVLGEFVARYWQE